MRVYGHLLAAIAAFVGIEAWLFRTGYAESITRTLLGVNWMLVLGGFMVAGWLARGLARDAEAIPALAEAVSEYGSPRDRGHAATALALIGAAATLSGCPRGDQLRLRRVVLRGREVVRDNEVSAPPGTGRHVRVA